MKRSDYRRLKLFREHVAHALGDYRRRMSDADAVATISQLLALRQPTPIIHPGTAPASGYAVDAAEAGWSDPADGVSIIIPSRDEARLIWTLDNIVATRQLDDPPAELVLVDDGGERPVEVPTETMDALVASGLPVTVSRLQSPVGNCFARHHGITLARYNCCLLLDAHMDFPPGGWLADVYRIHRERPGAVACAVCTHMSDDGRRDAFTRAGSARYYGAAVAERQTTTNGERRILQGVWNRGPRRDAIMEALKAGEAAPTASTMGGAYIVPKDVYTTRLAGVWQYLRGWGTAEPTLCLWAHMMGVPVEVWPVEIGHLFRGKTAVPYATRTVYIRYNQVFLARLLMGPGEGWQSLASHLRMQPDWQAQVDAMIDAVPWEGLDGHRDACAVMDYDALAAQWIDRDGHE